MENGHVKEVASLMEGEWFCYKGGLFNGGGNGYGGGQFNGRKNGHVTEVASLKEEWLI